MKEIKPPKLYRQPGEFIDDTSVKVFLAGGISGCPDWQGKFVKKYPFGEVTYFNPRRDDFDITKPEMSVERALLALRRTYEKPKGNK